MEEILQSAEEKTKRIAVLQDYDKYLNDLLTSMNRKKEELDELCAEVSGIRKKAAKGLTKAIAQALEDLNFFRCAVYDGIPEDGVQCRRLG